jgi:hypothetical protein
MLLLIMSCNIFFAYPNKTQNQIHLTGEMSLLKNRIKGCNGKVYSLRLYLANNSDKVSEFMLMKCSWEDNFLFKNNDAYFISKDCNTNYPRIVRLQPNKKLELSSLICYIGKTKLNLIGNLGFVLIEKGEISYSDDYFKLLKRKKVKRENVIWFRE